MQELGGLEREADLASHRLHQCEVRRGPRPGLCAADAEHAGRAAEDHDRRGSAGSRTELQQRLATAERLVVQLGAVDASVTAIVRCSRMQRFATGMRTAVWAPIGPSWSTCHCARTTGVTRLLHRQADEAALHGERAADLSHGNVEHFVDTARAAQPRRDRAHDPLSLDRGAEIARRARRSRVGAASAASFCATVSSSGVKARGALTDASTSTPITRRSASNGTNAVLCTPARCVSRRLTRCECAASYTAKAAASWYALATPDGSLVEVEPDVAEPVDVAARRCADDAVCLDSFRIDHQQGAELGIHEAHRLVDERAGGVAERRRARDPAGGADLRSLTVS